MDHILLLVWPLINTVWAVGLLVYTHRRQRAADRAMVQLQEARLQMKRGFEEARALMAYGAMDEGIQMLIETSAAAPRR